MFVFIEHTILSGFGYQQFGLSVYAKLTTKTNN